MSAIEIANSHIILAHATIDTLRRQRKALANANIDLFVALTEAQEKITQAYNIRDDAAMDAAVAIEARIMDDHDAIFGAIDKDISEATRALREARTRFYKACDDQEDEEARAEGRGPVRA